MPLFFLTGLMPMNLNEYVQLYVSYRVCVCNTRIPIARLSHLWSIKRASGRLSHCRIWSITGNMVHHRGNTGKRPCQRLQCQRQCEAVFSIPYKAYFKDGKDKNVQRGGRTITLVMDANKKGSSPITVQYHVKKSHFIIGAPTV